MPWHMDARGRRPKAPEPQTLKSMMKKGDYLLYAYDMVTLFKLLDSNPVTLNLIQAESPVHPLAGGLGCRKCNKPLTDRGRGAGGSIRQGLVFRACP